MRVIEQHGIIYSILTGGNYMGFTYKLLRILAWVFFACGIITALYGLSITSGDSAAAIAVPLFFYGILGGAISGSLFLFCAKLIKQNEERFEQNEKLLKLLSNLEHNTKIIKERTR